MSLLLFQLKGANVPNYGDAAINKFPLLPLVGNTFAAFQVDVLKWQGSDIWTGAIGETLWGGTSAEKRVEQTNG
ncbi:hypothetical protein QE152_g14280 [Popillia japonica]|uniref:Uncharacterized protein n=1 Tax=Popillia japonica TaxID=7064 RepID=A0AAW1L9V5_POPJA